MDRESLEEQIYTRSTGKLDAAHVSNFPVERVYTFQELSKKIAELEKQKRALGAEIIHRVFQELEFFKIGAINLNRVLALRLRYFRA